MLEVSQIFAYTGALSIAAAIPGPGMTALVARSVSGGALTGFSMLFGLIIGDLIYLSFAVFGLSIIANNFDTLFFIVRWCAAIYLSYLAWQFWFANHQSIRTDQPINKTELASAWFSGLAITLSNPKTIAFYLALLPLVVNLQSISLQSWGLVLVPLTILVLLCVGAVFIFGAISVRHFLSHQRAQKILFRSAAVMMLVAAVVMLFN